MYTLKFTKQAAKDAVRIKHAGLGPNVKKLLEVLRKDPFCMSPPYEKLVGDLHGLYSRRINIQHRLVYQVYPTEQIVKILRLWTHYE